MTDDNRSPVETQAARPFSWEAFRAPPVVAEVVPEAEAGPPQSFPDRRVALPVALFFATCMSTFFAGSFYPVLEGIGDRGLVPGLASGLWEGFLYAAAAMTILLCHEMGHFLQARRYGVYCSLPYFMPVPVPPIGTFGAVIAMQSRMGHRRALFDIGITGPLMGLVPTLLFCLLGLYWSEPTTKESSIYVGSSLLFQWLAQWTHGPLPPDHALALHPLAFAGWFGLLITSLNLLPIGQLDGGHILYALLRRHAVKVATAVLLAAIVAIGMFQLLNWMLMLLLVMFMGPGHPPTANDDEPLGLGRYILGWLTLGFVLLGFTPNPFPAGP